MESYNKEHADNPIDIQYTDADASAALIDLYNGCYDDIMNLFKPSAIWEGIVRIVPNIPQTLEIADVQIHSKNLARNLQGCSEVCLMAATLGIGPDRLIARASAVRMSDAGIYQAAAAAMVETYCDEVNERIRQDAAQRGMYCRPRFSPGYGDFPIAHQRDFSRLLDTPRKIGLTVTESCLLAPIKSVTAVIGLSETPQPCHRKGCEECGKTDCAYRR